MVKFLKVRSQEQRQQQQLGFVATDAQYSTPSFSPSQPGKVVILLTGRFAGKKAVIVKNYDDGQGGRAYGHAIVVGLQKEPRKVGVCVIICVVGWLDGYICCWGHHLHIEAGSVRHRVD